ncbi:hypothetical protein AB0L68_30965 [Streptomyces sp. NPDC052164]|uniref:hypothetical protein n=1 Tax=Streptomyces sp. NPDC052164 TaxID=3155529 RepID=UPI00343DE572
MNSVAALLWSSDVPSPPVVPHCRPGLEPRVPLGGLGPTAGRSVVGTLRLECSLCGATAPVHVLGDDLDGLAVDALDHLARRHPGSAADVLVMHQHTASGIGTPDEVATWVRGHRAASKPSLTE